VLTRAIHWSLSWARFIQFISSHPISPKSLLKLSIHLRFGLPLSGFPTNILYGFLFSPICAKFPTHLIFIDLITLISFPRYLRKNWIEWDSTPEIYMLRKGVWLLNSSVLCRNANKLNWANLGLVSPNYFQFHLATESSRTRTILTGLVITFLYTGCGISQLTAAHFVGGHILGN
jgi:hypothetical protein